jgi:antitoxin VapB
MQSNQERAPAHGFRPKTAKVFFSGRSQAVRLPAEFRFTEKEVYIRRDPATGDVILSRRPASWEGFFALDATTEVPADFMSNEDRQQGQQTRDPFADHGT